MFLCMWNEFILMSDFLLARVDHVYYAQQKGVLLFWHNTIKFWNFIWYRSDTKYTDTLHTNPLNISQDAYNFTKMYTYQTLTWQRQVQYKKHNHGQVTKIWKWFSSDNVYEFKIHVSMYNGF